MTGESTADSGSEKSVFEEVEFQLPSWAGRPPNGMHLDVLKGDKLVQKLMIDEKRCYFFGRNPKQCDFAIDHASCSRVHAVLVYHKHLNRFFLIDLGSTHGTFIGRVRLEHRKPEQVQLDQTFHFGASTRRYILRSRLRPSTQSTDNDEEFMIDSDSRTLNLPEKEEELSNLTEYNTALNRRIVAMNVPDDQFKAFPKRKQLNVSFLDDEQIINPEDIDPSIGRFRNLVHTAVVTNKRLRLSLAPELSDFYESTPHLHSASIKYPANPVGRSLAGGHLTGFGPMSTKLGLSMPNPAPDIDLYNPLPPPNAEFNMAYGPPISNTSGQVSVPKTDEEPRKKKYAKEAWPGKKPGSHLLVP